MDIWDMISVIEQTIFQSKILVMQTDHFTVPFMRAGNRYTVQVHTEPSTDDVDTYICHLNGERITQIRKDVGQWKQLWGELNETEINQIGEAIDTELAR
ncbi:hypothetical protein GCM10027566_19840 [Arachidicoccus ginsenosidivorans]|jgi:hypothetical protein